MQPMSYIYDPTWERERERLTSQELLFDPGTIDLLERIGVAKGWRCAEIGAGAGSIARWLGERVGDGGQVLATDVNTRFLDSLPGPWVEVRQHDIVTDPLVQSAYDLIHARLVLMHLPGRDRALRRMVDALRPGGWLLLEDCDTLTWGLFHPPSERQERVAEAVRRLFVLAGADPYYGRRLFVALQNAHLADVQAEGRLTLVTPPIDPLTFALEQLREKLVLAGLLELEDVDCAIAEVRGTLQASGYTPLMIAAWGRRSDTPLDSSLA
jgi:SAM-dependent methyltransferase